MSRPMLSIGRGIAFAAMALLAFTLPLFAELPMIQLPDGRVLYHAEITDRDDAYLTIQHASGVARVPISTLSPEMKKSLGYDPLKAAVVLAAERKAARQFEEAQAERKRQERLDSRKVFITGVVRERRADGYIVMDATRYGETDEKYAKFEPAEIGENWKPQKKEVLRKVTREIRMEGVFVAGLPEKVQPGQNWSGPVWPAGESAIRNKTGAVVGMRTRYATSAALATELIEQEKVRATQSLKGR